MSDRAIAFFTFVDGVPATLDGIGTEPTSHDGNGYVCYKNVPEGWTASHLTLPETAKTKAYSAHVPLPETGSHDFFLSNNREPEGRPLGPNQSTLPPVERKDLLPVSIRGLDFLVNGSRWLMKGSTELVLGELFERGIGGRKGSDVVREILRDRKAVGANTVRWLCQHQFRGRWAMSVPGIRGLVDLAEAEGFYSQVCILADVWQTVAEQQARVAAVNEVLQGTHALPQLGNEFNKNGFSPTDFKKPAGSLLWANASTTQDYQGWAIYRPVWDYVTFSGAREPMEKAMLGYVPWETQYEVAHVPILIGEAAKPGVNSMGPKEFYRAGRAASGCNGGFLHTAAGTSDSCRLFTDIERACGTELFTAMA